MTDFSRFDPRPISDAVMDVWKERERQIAGERWSREHDDAHGDGSLAKAAACYALGATSLPGTVGGKTYRKIIWPRSWAIRWWKPKDRRRDLVRAAALIVAEIERIDRAKARSADEDRGPSRRPPPLLTRSA